MTNRLRVRISDMGVETKSTEYNYLLFNCTNKSVKVRKYVSFAAFGAPRLPATQSITAVPFITFGTSLRTEKST